MPKMKSKRSAQKRLRLTSSGKVKFNSAGKRHLLSAKSRKRKRQLRKGKVLAESIAKKMRQIIS